MATVEMKWQSNVFRFLASYSDIQKNFNPEVGSVRRPGRKIIHAEFRLSSRLQQESNVGSLIRDVFPLFIADYTVLPNGETEVQFVPSTARDQISRWRAFSNPVRSDFQAGGSEALWHSPSRRRLQEQ